jgi:hypothetical protein
MVLRYFALAHDEARRRAADYALTDAPAGCEVVFREARRDSAINAALHATLTEIAKRRKWCGQNQDVETWKRLFTAAWLRATGEPVTMLPAIDGNGVDIVFKRTSTMTQREVSDLLAYIEAWDAEHD